MLLFERKVTSFFPKSNEFHSDFLLKCLYFPDLTNFMWQMFLFFTNN